MVSPPSAADERTPARGARVTQQSPQHDAGAGGEARDVRAPAAEATPGAAPRVSGTVPAGATRRSVWVHPFARASLWFLAVLALLEGLVRWKGDAFIASGEDAEFRRRFHWLAAQPRADVLVLGDSLAQRGLSPAGLATGGVAGALNAGVSAGSGIVAEALASAVSWRPGHVVFASNPAEALDDCDLNRHEEELVSLFDRRAWPFLTGAMVVGRGSQLFARRTMLQSALIRAAHERRPFPARDFLWPEGMTEQPDGFLAVRPPHPPTADEREHWSAVYVPAWFKHPERVSGLRREALVRAMEAWSAPGALRTLVIMPQSSEYRALIPQHESPARIRAAWREAADRAGAALIDCSAGAPDWAFADADHLQAGAAVEFSTLLGRWLRGGEAPAGCEVLRARGAAGDVRGH